MRIHKCKASYYRSPAGQQVVMYEVLYDGVKYRCDSAELDRLYKGVDPAAMDLVEITDSDEETEAFERAEAWR